MRLIQSLAITLRTKVTPVHKVTELLQILCRMVVATEEKGAGDTCLLRTYHNTNDAVTELCHELEKRNIQIQVQEDDVESAEAIEVLSARSHLDGKAVVRVLTGVTTGWIISYLDTCPLTIGAFLKHVFSRLCGT